jgi:extracellular factor (EF) 3-hydroxypalmitic acid methyl ester biosynthesis protein
MNRVFLNTSPVIAHQNRIVYLTAHLLAETRRLFTQGRPCRIYNLGCGPAKEIQDFISNHDLSDHVQFTLLDFNEETLAYTSKVLTDLKNKSNRATSVQMIKRSVHQVLKDAGKAGSGPKYDFVYCAGLFDYLSDPVCRKLMNYFYDLVAPGGLLLCTNVSVFNPSRNWMEYVLDWHLIYRNAAQMEALIPLGASAENARVIAIGDGVNLSLEVRKPLNGN